MLPRNLRLTKKSAFAATYRVKHSVYKGGVALFAGISKKNDDDITRVGFVVSKKTHKRAVKRNRLKRLMRESYRLLLKEGQVGNSQKYLSIIFVGHERAIGKSFNEMKSIVEKLLGEV